ncbi:MAG: insulinase family protein [Myxococcales bacterium]|nr:insulinase family protein [Myxococcales bacterium]MCB9714018.1 insulinase family protein [Myxococcales bacterium]
MPAPRRTAPWLSISLLCALAAGCPGKTGGDTDKPDLPPPDRELKLPDQGFLKKYDNGLTLFVVPDSYTSLVQFDVRQQVGSREDPEGKAGMAHFVEHLMFQMPVDGEGSPKLMSHLPQHSLTFNAYTSQDETHYMHTGTPEELESYMKYTALRLGYECDAVSEAEFLRERDVVRNEHRWRGSGVDAYVYSSLLSTVFPEGHPYHRSLVDIDRDLVSITPADTCEFIGKFYTASQAQVVVTGNVDPLEVLELANKYLEPLPTKPVAQRVEVPPIELRSRDEKILAPVKKPTAVVLWKMPKRFTPEGIAAQAALENMFLAVSVLTSIKDETGLIEDLGFTGFGGEEAQVFGVSIETKRAKDLDKGIDLVFDAVRKGFSADLKGEEMIEYQRARQNARLSVLGGISAIFSRSGAYADYLEEGDAPGFYGAELAQIDALTQQQAQEVGARIFARERAMVVRVLPNGTEDAPEVERASFDYKPDAEENLALPDDIDPAEAHRPLPFEDIAPAELEYVEFTLDNGMKAVLVRSSQVPVMDIQVIVEGGSADVDPPEIAALATQLYGPREDREAQNLSSFFMAAGGIFFPSPGPLSTTFRSRGLSIYLDFLIAGVSERVVQAQYRTESLDGWKMRMGDEFKKKKYLSQAIERENTFYRELYGKGHPHVREEIADRGRLKDVSLRDLEEFRSDYFRAANSAIIITGGFDMNLATQYVDRFFGNPDLRDRKNTWMEPRVLPPRPVPPEPTVGKVRTITEIDKERVQTTVTTAYPLAVAYGDDHAALAVLASMLDFEVSAVRQKLGASYGVYARLAVDRPRIEVGGAIDSARAGEGVAAIRAAVQRIRDGEDFDRRFAFARREVLKGMINAQADSELLAARLAEAVRNGKSYDYFRELAAKVASLEPEAVRAQIDRVLKDERAVTLVQGPAAGVANVVESNGMTDVLELPEVVHDEGE